MAEMRVGQAGAPTTAIPIATGLREVPADFEASPTSSPYTSPATSPVGSLGSSFGSYMGGMSTSAYSMSPPLLSTPPALPFHGDAHGGSGLLYPCLVCTQRFPTHQPLLEHMGLYHHLIISDLHQIADLPAY